MTNRLERLRADMKAENQCALLLNKPQNITYISGYAGEGCALVTMQGQYIITDFRYVEAAEHSAPGWKVIMTTRERKWDKCLAELLASEKPANLAVESDYVTHAQYRDIEAAANGIALEDIRAKPEKLRTVKDAQEIEFSRMAESITARSFNEVLSHIKVGMTELELRAELEYIMFKLGADGCGFSTIVASGENSSMPHAVPGSRRLREGDFITLDFGALYHGYTGDMTRTVALGYATDEMKKVYEIVRAAQQRVLDNIGPGKACGDMDKIARDYITKAGYGDCFGHSLGHGTGLEIHEAPACRAGNETLLQPGNTMTDEPGIYIAGRFGVRIEDLLVITETGYENLALEAPKELIII